MTNSREENVFHNKMLLDDDTIKFVFKNDEDSSKDYPNARFSPFISIHSNITMNMYLPVMRAFSEYIASLEEICSIKDLKGIRGFEFRYDKRTCMLDIMIQLEDAKTRDTIGFNEDFFISAFENEMARIMP